MYPNLENVLILWQFAQTTSHFNISQISLSMLVLSTTASERLNNFSPLMWSKSSINQGYIWLQSWQPWASFHARSISLRNRFWFWAVRLYVSLWLWYHWRLYFFISCIINSNYTIGFRNVNGMGRTTRIELASTGSQPIVITFSLRPPWVAICVASPQRRRNHEGNVS